VLRASSVFEHSGPTTPSLVFKLGLTIPQVSKQIDVAENF